MDGPYAGTVGTTSDRALLPLSRDRIAGREDPRGLEKFGPQNLLL